MLTWRKVDGISGADTPEAHGDFQIYYADKHLPAPHLLAFADEQAEAEVEAECGGCADELADLELTPDQLAALQASFTEQATFEA